MDDFTIISSFAQTSSRTCQRNLILLNTNNAISEDEWYDNLRCFPSVENPSSFLEDEHLYDLIIQRGYNMMMSLDLPYSFDDGRSVMCLLAKTDLDHCSEALSSMKVIYDWLEGEITSAAITDLELMFPELMADISGTWFDATLGHGLIGISQVLEDCRKEFQFAGSIGKKDAFKDIQTFLGQDFSEKAFTAIVNKIKKENSIEAKIEVSKHYTEEIRKYIQKTPFYKSIRIHLVNESDWPAFGICLNSEAGAKHRPRKFKYAILFEYVDSYKNTIKSCPLIFHKEGHLLYTLFLQAMIGRFYASRVPKKYQIYYEVELAEFYTDKLDKNTIGKLPDGRYINEGWKFTKPILDNIKLIKTLDNILFFHPQGYKFDEKMLKCNLIPSKGTISSNLYTKINKQVKKTIASLDVKIKDTPKSKMERGIDLIYFLFGINNKKRLAIDKCNIILDLTEEDSNALNDYFNHL